MATFLVEHHIPGASELMPEQLREITATSNKVVEGLGAPYWRQRSYVAGDRIYCRARRPCRKHSRARPPRRLPADLDDRGRRVRPGPPIPDRSSAPTSRSGN
jgi:hypothetical protein